MLLLHCWHCRRTQTAQTTPQARMLQLRTQLQMPLRRLLRHQPRRQLRGHWAVEGVRNERHRSQC